MESSHANRPRTERGEAQFEISHLAETGAVSEKSPTKKSDLAADGEFVRLAQFFVGALIVLGFLTVIRQLGLDFAAEWIGLDNDDTPLYRAVGRGILNGLRPYLDLYETKPPGLFYLCAASQKFFGSFALEKIAQILALVATFTFLNLSLFFQSRMRALPVLEKISISTINAIITYFVAYNAAGVQSECFGATFALGYLTCIVGQTRLSKARTALAAAFIALACGFKEPFFIVSLGGYLLLPSPKPNLTRGFIVPAICAVLAGLLILLLTGNFAGYVTFYLPSIFETKVAGQDSLFSRSLNLNIILSHLRHNNPALSVVFYVGLFGLLSSHVRPKSVDWKSVAGNLVGLWLLVFSVALGVAYWSHHFVCFAPAFLPLLQGFAAVIVRANERWEGQRKLLVTSLMIGLAICALGIRKEDPIRSAKRIQAVISVSEYDAKIIDEILDRCHLDRYFFFGGNGFQPYQFTRHSPLGPNFFQFGLFYPEGGSMFSPLVLPALRKADVVAFESFNLGSKKREVMAEMLDSFRPDAPNCAGNFSKPKKVKLLFRKSFAAEK